MAKELSAASAAVAIQLSFITALMYIGWMCFPHVAQILYLQ